VRKRTRLAAVLVSSVLGALVAHLGGPLSFLGPGAAGFLGSAAALAGYALGKRKTPTPPAGGIAGRVALVGASLIVLVVAEVVRPRVLPAISRRSPLASVALTGGEAGPLSELARARAAGGESRDAVALYRAAFALDGLPRHLANATFAENRVGRCSEARALASEAVGAAHREGVTAWDRHLAARAADVASRCSTKAPRADRED
jgi:hypothetical protein